MVLARERNGTRDLMSSARRWTKYSFVFLPVAVSISGALIKPDYFFLRGLLELPLAVRVVLYYMLADLGLYAVHRLMHTRYLWRIHRWHHSPPYTYWRAGIRASVPNHV